MVTFSAPAFRHMHIDGCLTLDISGKGKEEEQNFGNKPEAASGFSHCVSCNLVDSFAQTFCSTSMFISLVSDF